MKCTKCGGETRIYDKRPIDDSKIFRKRECLKCKHRFKTYEVRADELEILFKKARKKAKVTNGGSRDTLCWRCGNACGGCSWADEFKAVDGWLAVETEIPNYTGGTTRSYKVINCPKFFKG